MRAISVLSFDAGTSTRACLARAALRMRVSKSEMGSVCISSRPLPASLQHARDFAPQRQAAEADAAHLELAQVPARPAAYAAAVAHADFVLRLPAHLGELTGSRHRFSSRLLSRYPRSGTPSSLSNSRPSSSLRAVVVRVIFIPLILSTRV